MKKDIRFKLLIYLQKTSNSPAEKDCNNFLCGLHNDAGTVRRCLVELHDEGLIGISESNIKVPSPDGTERKLWGHIYTKKNKDSKRFCDNYKEEDKINPTYLWITSKGLLFLHEYRKSNNQLSTNNIVKVGVLLAFAVGVANLIVDIYKPTTTHIEIQKIRNAKKECLPSQNSLYLQNYSPSKSDTVSLDSSQVD